MLIRVGSVHRKHSIISRTRNRKVGSCRPCHAFMALELLDNRDYVLSVPCAVRLRLFVNARTSVSWSCSGCPDHSKPCSLFLLSGAQLQLVSLRISCAVTQLETIHRSACRNCERFRHPRGRAAHSVWLAEQKKGNGWALATNA